jgi:hypothetical protein
VHCPQQYGGHLTLTVEERVQLSQAKDRYPGLEPKKKISMKIGQRNENDHSLACYLHESQTTKALLKL